MAAPAGPVIVLNCTVFCVLLPLWPRRRPLWAPINSPELFAADIFSLVWRKCLPQGALDDHPLPLKSHLQLGL